MNHPSLLALDTLDDRREIYHLLRRLSPRRRVAFLADCCKQVRAKTPNDTGPTPSLLRMGPTIKEAYRCDRANDRLTNMIYFDVLALSSQWHFDLGGCLPALVRLARAAG